MTIIRRSVGLAIVLLSVCGLLLCMSGAAGVLACRSRVDVVLAAVFATADDAFDFIDTRLDRVEQALDTSQQRVSGVLTLAERLKSADAQVDASTDLQPLLLAFDQVHDQLQAAEHWLDSSQAIAGGVNRVSDALAGTKGQMAAIAAQNVTEFCQSVADAMARLDDMRKQTADLREKRILAHDFAAAMIARATDLVERLGNLATRVEAFRAEVAIARTSSADLRHGVHWWTTFAAVMLTLILIWFSLSQVAMMKWAWRFTRRSAGTTREAHKQHDR